jgi:hypothetical protein
MATSGIDSTTTAAILTAMHGGTAVTFATPIKLLFLSAVRSSDTGSDTEWSTSGGYTAGTGYSGLTFAAASAGAPSTQASNVAATITNAPAVTWAGCVEVDSSGTPKKLFWAALASSKTVNAGDTVTVPSGQLTDSLG